MLQSNLNCTCNFPQLTHRSYRKHNRVYRNKWVETQGGGGGGKKKQKSRLNNIKLNNFPPNASVKPLLGVKKARKIRDLTT